MLPGELCPDTSSWGAAGRREREGGRMVRGERVVMGIVMVRDRWVDSYGYG